MSKPILTVTLRVTLTEDELREEFEEMRDDHMRVADTPYAMTFAQHVEHMRRIAPDDMADGVRQQGYSANVEIVSVDFDPPDNVR